MCSGMAKKNLNTAKNLKQEAENVKKQQLLITRYNKKMMNQLKFKKKQKRYRMNWQNITLIVTSDELRRNIISFVINNN